MTDIDEVLDGAFGTVFPKPFTSRFRRKVSEAIMRVMADGRERTLADIGWRVDASQEDIKAALEGLTRAGRLMSEAIGRSADTRIWWLA